MSWKLFLYDWGGLNIALFQAINTGTPATLKPLAWFFGLVGSYWTAPLMLLGLWWWSKSATNPAIEDQTHSLFLRMVAQAQQRRIAAKLRINATIILGIIFMHAGGDKYRVQVQRRYAKLLQVRQPLADTIEIAAVKGGAARLGG